MINASATNSTASVSYTTSMFWKKEVPFLTCSRDEFIERLKNKEPSYEVLEIDIRCLYFDIDVYTSRIKKQDAAIIEQKGEEYIRYALQQQNDIKIAIATSHGKFVKDGETGFKYSVRYWLPGFKAHRKTILAFVKELNKHIINTSDTDADHLFEYVGDLFETTDKNGKKVYSGLFDEGIYNTDRKMRCIGTSKINEDRPLVMKSGEIADTIISATENAFLLEGNTPEEQGVKISSENEHIQKYCDYVSIIDKQLFEQYGDWFKFQRASANLLIPFDVYDQYMRGCKGYNYDNNKKAYEVPNNDAKGKLGWKFIYDLAFQSNPEEKAKIDQKWGRDVFCKYKFRRICNKISENGDNYVEVFKEAKTYFEKYHFKVLSPYCFGRITEDGTDFVSRDTLMHIYENLYIQHKNKKDELERVKFITHWVSDENIMEYEGYDFVPPPNYISSSKYNLFRGFAHEKILPFEIDEQQIKDDAEIFVKHLWYLSGKNNDVLNYVLDYLAHMIQEPGELPRTAIVFKSEQGVGKNLFFETFAEKILGDKYLLSTPNIDHILGRFPLINQKIMVLMDEANGKDSFLANDKIKNFITAKTINYEKKGIDGVDIHNCSRMFFFTNNDFPVKIEQTDRRFVVVECANDIRNNSKYFKALLNAFNDKRKVWAFAQVLLKRNITEWDSVNDRPITQLYKEVQRATVPSEQRFFTEYEYFKQFEIEPDDDAKYSGKELYQLYSNFCSFLPKRLTPITEMTFLKRLKDYESFLIRKRTNTNVRYWVNKVEFNKYITEKQCSVEDAVEVQDDFVY
jgi:hypothetical protein